MLLGIGDPGESVLDQQLVDVPGVLVGLVDLGRPGGDLVLGKLAYRLAERLLFVGEFEAESVAHAFDGNAAGG